jgi:ferritin
LESVGNPKEETVSLRRIAEEWAITQEKEKTIQTKEGQKIQSQINELKRRIDQLSDLITPDFMQSYLS